jgi:integrase
MAVNKRSNSRFWYIQFQFNGKTYLKSSKTTDKQLAEQLEIQWRKQLFEQSQFGIKPPIGLAEAFQLYSDSKRSIASHRHLHRWALRSAAFFSQLVHLHDLQTSHVERFRLNLESRCYSAQMIKHIMNIIGGTIKYAKKMGYRTPEIELPSVRLPKGRLRYLTFDEEQRFLQAIDPARDVKGLAPYDKRIPAMREQMQDLYDLAILLLDTGARLAEIATLEWARIDLDHKTIGLWRPKVQNESVLYMSDRVFAVLSRRFPGRTTPYVFTSKAGGPRNSTTHVFQRAFKRAGLEGCSAHTLRHTHATRLIQHGLNLYEVKEILGHSDIKTTMRYAHIEKQSVSRKATDLINSINHRSDRDDPES